jgi:hypothetical protein
VVVTDLSSFGIRPLSAADGDVHFAVLRMARQLAMTERKVIGLLPATPQVGVAGLGVQLALAMVQLNLAPIAWVDAHPKLPAYTGLVAEDLRNSEGFVSLMAADGLVISTRATPVRRNGSGNETLQQVLLSHRQRFKHVLLDLTGFRELGEHLWAFDLVDGVLLVAQVGKTAEWSVEQCHREIPPAASLGVLLVDV